MLKSMGSKSSGTCKIQLKYWNRVSNKLSFARANHISYLNKNQGKWDQRNNNQNYIGKQYKIINIKKKI